MDVPISDFRAALLLSEEERFRLLPDKKKADGTDRIVYNPDPLIRKIQRRFLTRILSRPSAVKWPEFLFGSIPNHSFNGIDVSRDYVACAARHCGSKSLLKLDIKSFFENVHSDLVLEIFRGVFSYGDLVSRVLTRICTHKGGLPQGGIVSSYLAMLCLHDVEARVVERLRQKRLTYTRYVDDITVSSKSSNQDFDFSKRIIEEMLLSKNLPLNYKKVLVSRVSTTALTVHGLRVGFKEPRLPADEVKRIRASVKYLEILYVDGDYKYTSSYRKNFNKCMGRVNKLKRVGHSQHGQLKSRIIRLMPKASRSDLARVFKISKRLQSDYLEKKDTFGFYKRFHILAERLNLVARTHPGIARLIRRRLREIKPTFE
ncbi:reverse transcriptase family protein [Xanthomonas sp. NCPPB 2865]|uniref:reverse transcriptase family protein n=1 Tax=Xanthomonas TaxID=338 RepID=UPI0015E35427|nr:MULTISPECIES: reverse transcriptase family protein [Xanthomonas]